MSYATPSWWQRHPQAIWLVLLALAGGMGAQLVRDDRPRQVLQALQQLAEEPVGCLGAVLAPHENVEHGPVLIDISNQFPNKP
jgi:hypothetical protein